MTATTTTDPAPTAPTKPDAPIAPTADAQTTRSAHTATARQRRRSALLAVLMLGLGAIGAASRIPAHGHVADPCAQPALRDGVLVCDGNGANAGARSWLAGGKLDVNTATVAQLEQIHGVGPSLARAIVDERDRRGRFQTFAELDDVPGIGPKTLAKLMPFLEVR